MCGSRRKQSTSSFKRYWGRRCKKQGLQLRHRSSGLSTTCSVGQSIACSLQAKGSGLSTPFSGSQVRASVRATDGTGSFVTSQELDGVLLARVVQHQLIVKDPEPCLQETKGVLAHVRQ